VLTRWANGRGCGAGPVVTAAVIMPKGFESPLIRDSKKLSPKKRIEAYELILSNAIAISCNAGPVSEIDSIGINASTFKTMRKCISELPSTVTNHILIDGTEWDNEPNPIPYTLVVKGDDTYTCIAAAAIVAKVKRDEYMCKLHLLHPQYNWDKNKGYLTPEHIEQLKEFGPTRYHREKFIRNFIKSFVI